MLTYLLVFLAGATVGVFAICLLMAVRMREDAETISDGHSTSEKGLF